MTKFISNTTLFYTQILNYFYILITKPLNQNITLFLTNKPNKQYRVYMPTFLNNTF